MGARLRLRSHNFSFTVFIYLQLIHFLPLTQRPSHSELLQLCGFSALAITSQDGIDLADEALLITSRNSIDFV